MEIDSHDNVPTLGEGNGNVWASASTVNRIRRDERHILQQNNGGQAPALDVQQDARPP
jgi:hypothetical protein